VLPCRASSTAAGSSNFNAVDRLAIENVIGSYSYLVDNNKIDAWLELFTADSVFETHIPGEPPEVLSFHQLSELANTRFAAFAKAGNQRRHLMAIVTFEDQTADSAHVFVEALITKIVSLADAAREPFIGYSREEFPDYHRRFNAVFAKVKAKPRIMEEHDGFSSIIPAIEARRGVALVSESFPYSAGNRVRLLRLTPEPKPSIIGIAAPAGPLSPAAEKFWQCAKQAALTIS
jgi:DNA-binding transcriptional LysR family regulator